MVSIKSRQKRHPRRLLADMWTLALLILAFVMPVVAYVPQMLAPAPAPTALRMPEPTGPVINRRHGLRKGAARAQTRAAIMMNECNRGAITNVDVDLLTAAGFQPSKKGAVFTCPCCSEGCSCCANGCKC